MDKVVKELVVEGPIVMENDPAGQEVFLFLQPIIEEGAYPVSYTHLDVYKRQMLYRMFELQESDIIIQSQGLYRLEAPEFSDEASISPWAEAVSYTHLDVYKRQP